MFPKRKFDDEMSCRPNTLDLYEGESIEHFNVIPTLTVVVLTSLLIISAIAIDITDYEPFEIERHFSGIKFDDTYYFVYHDYRNLYAAIAILEWLPSEDRSGSHIIYQQQWDCFRPEIYNLNGTLIVSWLELDPGGDKFAYAEYDRLTGKLDQVMKIDITINTIKTEHSFDGSNFTIATPMNDNINLWIMNYYSNETSNSTIPCKGSTGFIDVEDSRVYYGQQYFGVTTLYSYREGNISALAETGGRLDLLSGCNGHVAWIERNRGDGDTWGSLKFSNGNITDSIGLEEVSKSVSLFEMDEMTYIAYSEDIYDDDSENWAQELKLVRISNLSNPQMIYIDTLSKIDGDNSRLPYFIGDQDDLKLFWMDSRGEYSLYYSRIIRNSVFDGGTVISATSIKDSEFYLGVGFLSLGITLSLLVIAFRHKKKKVDEKAKDSEEEEERKHRAINFIHFNRREPYMYFKFYFPIVALILTIFAFIGLAVTGNGLVFRVGYQNVLSLYITLVASIFVLGVMKTESFVSMIHGIGYLLVITALLISIIGIFWYELSRTAYLSSLLFVLTSTTMAASSLVMIGPLVIFYGMSRNKGFLAPILPYAALVIFVLFEISIYDTRSFFPSVQAPSRLISFSTFFAAIMINLLFGIFAGMILFMALKVEQFKNVMRWTIKDVQTIKMRAIAFSTLMALVFIIIVLLTFVFMSPYPDWDMISESPFITFMMIGVGLLLISISRWKMDLKEFENNFIDDPSDSIYGIFMHNIWTLMGMMLVAMFFGAFSLIIIVYYAYCMIKGNSIINNLDLEKAKKELERKKMEKNVG